MPLSARRRVDNSLMYTTHHRYVRVDLRLTSFLTPLDRYQNVVSQ